MKVNKQKLVVIGSMTLLLAAAVILNHKLGSGQGVKNVSAPKAVFTEQPAATLMPEESVDAAAQMVGFFADYKADRDAKRADEAAYLDSVLNDANTDAATRDEAQKMKLELADTLEKELAIEALLMAKGFEEAAAIFHTGSVNIVVGSPQLSDAEVAQILSIVQQESGENAENIKIIPVQ